MLEFILDVNFSFNPLKKDYPDYLVADLLSQKRVGLVRGGSQYTREVSNKTKLVELFNTLSRAGKVRRIDDEQVDNLQREIEQRIEKRLGGRPSECDDPHIFALALKSNCRRVVSKDERMARCRDKIRGSVGHTYCPDVAVIFTEKVYRSQC